MNRKRAFYLGCFLLLLFIESSIALFAHDAFVRPYLGDVLAVMTLYCFVRIFVPEKARLLPLWVFLFAAGVEILQLFHPARLFGNGAFVRTVLGSSFDPADIACYFTGCVLLGGWERFRRRKKQPGGNANDEPVRRP